VKQRNEEADADEHMLRISLDAKATVKVGPFARGGKSRVPPKAADHDFEAAATVTPVGLFLPASDELFLYAVTSKVTSDCLVDRLVDWWESVKERFPDITTLVINLDNGPECHSRRTQFMQRLVEFAQRYHLTIRLAYYPPYPSQVQSDRAMLGHFRTALERDLARFARGRDPVCYLHDLERQTSRGLTGDRRLSDRGHIEQGGDGRPGNPVSAFPTSA
jgi:hypothetical protein